MLENEIEEVPEEIDIDESNIVWFSNPTSNLQKDLTENHIGEQIETENSRDILETDSRV